MEKKFLLLVAWLLLLLQVHAQSITINGLHVVANGSPQLVFQNLGFTNNGYFKAANSTVIFTDSTSALPVSLGGNNKTSFHQLVINQNLQLANNVQVTGNIYLNRGNLQLDHYTLDLGRSGTIIGERNESRIIGKTGGIVTRTALLQSPNAINPGNIGVSITSSANLGETVITRGHGSPLHTTGAASTDRYFDIAPTFNKDLNASLQFHYLDAELSGNENELMLFSTDGFAWKPGGKDNSNMANNWLIKNRLSQLHRYTLAGSKASKTVQVYPNPVRDKFTVVLPLTSKQDIVLLLFDQSGQVVERKKLVCREGINTIEWNISRYAAGNYYLSFEGMDINTVKIIKE